MKSLELFAGIGGIALGAEWAGIEPIAFCEKNLFCQKVLKKHWPDVPIFDDVKTLNKKVLKESGIDVESIELISGGFPCQPFSQAGKKKGKNDDRDLWLEMFRIIREIKPRWIVGENVANFANMELGRTIANLESEGYDVQSFIIPACGVNARHRRERIFIVAHLTSDGRDSRRGDRTERYIQNDEKRNLSEIHQEWEKLVAESGEISEIFGWGGNQPRMGRVADGIPDRVDRIKSLGNAVVPQQIYPIFQAIVKLN